MTNIITIEYDLIKEKKNEAGYNAIKKFIEANYSDYKKPLFSCYAVKTSDTTKEVWKKIQDAKLVDDNDSRLIDKLSPSRTGRLGSNFWEWSK